MTTSRLRTSSIALLTTVAIGALLAPKLGYAEDPSDQITARAQELRVAEDETSPVSEARALERICMIENYNINLPAAGDPQIIPTLERPGAPPNSGANHFDIGLISDIMPNDANLVIYDGTSPTKTAWPNSDGFSEPGGGSNLSSERTGTTRLHGRDVDCQGSFESLVHSATRDAAA